MLLFLVWSIVHQHHADNKKRYHNPGKGPADGLNDTKIITDAKYSVKMSRKKYI